MKNFGKFFVAIAAAVVALSGCQKVDEQIPSTTKTVSFFARSIETKTAFGEKEGTSYPTLWTDNDTKVAVSLNRAAAKQADVIPADDYKTATFDVEIEDDLTGSYAFTAVSPASAALGISAEKGINIQVPTTQTPTEASVDEAAQILVATTSEVDVFPDEVTLDFTHFTAYGKISILNLESGSTISAISLTADSNWAGRWYYNNGVVSENSASATITINTTSAADNWFACAPVELGGQDIKVTVTTDKGNYVKTITLPTGKKFESGKIAKFSVDFDGITTDEDVIYTLVKDIADLTVGSEVIIAASSSGFALGTTQNSSNRAAVAITKTGETIKNPGDDVQILTLGKGNKTNTAAFYTGAGYLYASSSSSNQLKTETTLSDNSSFAITITSAGVASATAQGSYTRNQLKKNSSSALFACYSSGQDDIAIYKKNGSGTDEAIFGGSSVPEYASLADLVAAGTPTGGKVTVTLTDEVIVDFYTSGDFTNGVYLMVGDKKIEIYCKNVPSDWELYGTISGTLEECDWKDYKGTWELCPTSWDDLDYTAPASNVNVTGVSLNKTTASIAVDGTITLTATVAPANATNKNVTWSSNDEDVATVVDGVVTGVSEGEAVITVTTEDGSFTATCTVTVSSTASAVAKFIYADLYSSVTTGSLSLDGSSDTVDGVTIAYAKVSGSNAPQYYFNGTNLRIYNESTMTVTAPSGKMITSIKAAGTTTWASTKMAADSGAVSDTDKEWTGKASVVVLTITGSFRFAEIDVTYE